MDLTIAFSSLNKFSLGASKSDGLFILSSFLMNYGFIMDQYTNYIETLPVSKGLSLIYKLRYINSLISLRYEKFTTYDIINIKNKLFIFNSSASLSISYSSSVSDLYFGNFNYDILTGVGASIETNYKTYLLNIGIQNLGPIGLVSAITINKLFN